jgi:DNA (cytosine-5)-methyltransferase 3A
MNVVSLFDGISCARVALDYAGIPVNKYYACEIDKFAIQVSKKNYPDIVRLGSVVDFKKDMVKEPIDLLIGGSPCQDLSIAKKDRKGLEGDRSSLFYEYVRIRDEVKPKYFILENVASMNKKDKDTITKIMGCEPIMFNASLVSAQTRKRYFWTNIKFDLPDDKGILLKDILQPDAEVDKRSIVKVGRIVGRRINDEGHRDDNNKNIPIKQRVEVRADNKSNNLSTVGKDNVVVNLSSNMVKIGHIGKSNSQANRVYSPVGKSCTLSALGGGLGAKTGLYDLPPDIRRLTPIECERLQSLPDDYTEGISNTQRYKCLGNAFNCRVIEHILTAIPKRVKMKLRLK